MPWGPRALDKRWPLVVGTLGAEEAPFAPGALVACRARLIAHALDRRLVSRTGEGAKSTGKLGWQLLRAVWDSSPLLGAGRVEDTGNLLGRAMSQWVRLARGVMGLSQEATSEQAGVTLLGQASLTAALDCDGDAPHARHAALPRRVAEAEALVRWGQQPSGVATQAPPLDSALAAITRLMPQDLARPPPAVANGLYGARHGIVCRLWAIVRCVMGAKAQRLP
jgi:hypothetical protein